MNDENSYILFTAYFCLLFNNLFVPMIVLSRFRNLNGEDFIPTVYMTSWFPYVDNVVK